MKKQEILSRFIKQSRIENYAEATVKNYASALKLFLQWVSALKVNKISDDDIQNYFNIASRRKSTRDQITSTRLFSNYFIQIQHYLKVNTLNKLIRQ